MEGEPGAELAFLILLFVYIYLSDSLLSRKEIQELNWSRKSMQTKAGEELRHLESSWVSLVSRNYQIEQACVLLEVEISKLEREKDTSH